jgi:hypothetical protein
MFEQGAGELNVEGAVRVAACAVRSYLIDTDRFAIFDYQYASDSANDDCHTFTWSSGLIMNHSYLTGRT